MIDFKYPTFFLIILITLVSCTKDKTPEPGGEIDTNGYYVDYIPDIVLNSGDSLWIDVDNNSTADVSIWIDSYGIQTSKLNSEFTVSIGNFIGSGSSNVDTIAYNEIIDNSLYWGSGFNLFTSQIHYLGVKREVNNTTTFGWIKINISGGSITIDDHYFRFEEGTVVRAGIKTY